MSLDAIRSVLAAYRSETTVITQEQIAAAWAEYDQARRDLIAVSLDEPFVDHARTAAYDEQAAHMVTVHERWPTIAKWAAGGSILGHDLIRELDDAAAYVGGGRARVLGEALERIVDIHHRTVVGSKLHDPEQQDWRDCPCKTCAAVATALPTGERP